VQQFMLSSMMLPEPSQQPPVPTATAPLSQQSSVRGPSASQHEPWRTDPSAAQHGLTLTDPSQAQHPGNPCWQGICGMHLKLAPLMKTLESRLVSMASAIAILACYDAPSKPFKDAEAVNGTVNPSISKPMEHLHFNYRGRCR